MTPEKGDRKMASSVSDTHHEIEPHGVSTPYQDPNKDGSLLGQVANHILGSWDTSIACTQDSTHDGDAMTRWSSGGGEQRSQYSSASLMDADMADEEEGQEVELVEMEEEADEVGDVGEETSLSVGYVHTRDDLMVTADDEPRMPPPPVRRDTSATSPRRGRRIEIDWPSKMVGCQSTWLPETFNPPSFFSHKANPLSPSASLEMDGSAMGTEVGSIGGASLCQVFSHEQLPAGADTGVAGTGAGVGAGATRGEMVSHPAISQMPSWERSFRSKSPSTVCSDPSIVSKASERHEGQMSPLNTPASPRPRDTVE